MSIPERKKMTVIIRVEPGCLGPDGLLHCEPFCDMVKKQLSHQYTDFLAWQVVPRYDKRLPEIGYTITERNLKHAQAQRYLALFHLSVDELEMEICDLIPEFIDEYFQRSPA